ncbi:HAD family hydrolase [Candidatus Riflebacteria bacterium]
MFDFDGVILESAKIKTQAYRKLFASYPKSEEIVNYHLENLGISRFEKFAYYFKEILKRPYTPQDSERLGKEYSRIIFRQVLEAPFVPGTFAFLEKSNLLHFIASGTPEEELLRVVRERDLSKYFVEIYGSPPKKWEIIRKILKNNSLALNETVLIGDGKTDLDAAEKCGIPFIARLTEENMEFLQATPWKIKDLTSLTNILTQMQSNN